MLFKIKILCLIRFDGYNEMMPSRTTHRNINLLQASPGQPNTRERILAYFKENHAVTVQEVSRALGLTRADIRYHFNGLVHEGVLETAPRDPSRPASRGRPEQRYRQVDGTSQSALVSLCAALLDTYIGEAPVDLQEQALRALSKKMAGDLHPAPHLTQRLNQATELLNVRGYQARWEAHASGPRIILRSCPFAALLPSHPYLCKLDQFFLEQYTRIPLQLTERMNFAGSRPRACIFTRKQES